MEDNAQSNPAPITGQEPVVGTPNIPSAPTSTPLQPATVITEPVKPTKPPTNKKMLFIPLALLFLILLLALGYYLYKNNSTPEPTPTPSSESTPSPTPDPTANWNLFQSALGYSLRYPTEMTIGGWGFDEENTENSINVKITPAGSKEPLDEPHMTIAVISNSESTLKQVAEDNYNKNINHPGNPATVVEEFKESTFLNLPSYEYTLNNTGIATPYDEYLGYDGDYKVVWVESEGKYIGIFTNDTPVLNQILSTFEFIDTSTNWQTHTDNQLGVSISYPSTWSVSKNKLVEGVSTFWLTSNSPNKTESTSKNLEIIVGSEFVYSTSGSSGIFANTTSCPELEVEPFSVQIEGKTYTTSIHDSACVGTGDNQKFERYSFYFKQEGDLPHITGTYFTAEELEEVKQILSTIKFTQ